MASYERKGRAFDPFEVGACAFDAGDMESAADHLVRVPATSPCYREACVLLVEACARLQRFSFEADHLLAAFIATDPRSPSELRAMYLLAGIYEVEGFEDAARDALRRIVRIAPDYADAARRLAASEAEKGMSKHQPIGREDSFWAPKRPSPIPSLEQELDGTTRRTPTKLPVVDINVAPKDVIGGRYRIEEQIGRGGTAVVYRARDLELEETVAIKVFSEDLSDPSFLARFKLELTVCRSIAHPNVIRVFDIGQHDRSRFISMELLDGKNLKHLLPLPFDAALGYLAQLLSGLSAIHARGVLHRDIKPANLFVTSAGVLKIMDFGLAKKLSDRPDLTGTGFMAGTPGYMPPEQVTDFGHVTAAADMYACGVVAYLLGTGVRPFRDPDPARVIRSQFTTVPDPPRTLVPSLPPSYDDLVMRLLDREPERRPRCDEALAIVRGLLSGVDATS